MVSVVQACQLGSLPEPSDHIEWYQLLVLQFSAMVFLADLS